MLQPLKLIEGLVRGGLLIEFLQQVRDSIKVGNEVQERDAGSRGETER